MSLESYWPTKDNILDCIKTEAEELSDHTLLAVHDPMHLTKLPQNDNPSKASEDEILNHLMEVERPIPIVGEAGVGKSHLIRWLHAKLKTQNVVIKDKWQIVRLPKNSSLRQTLHLLLKGLDGDVFEQARLKVDEVGDSLKESEIADLFVAFMAHRVADIELDTENELKSFTQRPDRDTYRAMCERVSFAKNLPNLINDVQFQLELLSESGCIYNIATRWIRGASDKKLYDTVYELSLDDFGTMLERIELDDLSLPARDAIKDLRLKDDIEQRQKAVNMINESIGGATQTAFQRLFQFNSGNFQDLFKEIRKHLKQLGRTLVILVEDMAAISAIENVLIDCLLEERQEDLCVLRSVIAVTRGYAGYERRKDTILSRARIEWKIDESNDTAQNIEKRIVDFCSRYLNASRFGKSQLSEVIKLEQHEESIPVWKEELSETDSKKLNAFGESSLGIPLFPYNQAAIIKLAQWYCSNDDNEVVFNPRDVINEVLLNVLRDHRDDYIIGKFPLNLSLKENKISLDSDINTIRLESPQQARVLSTIWSDGANLKAVKQMLNSQLALAFSLNDFAQQLSSDTEVKVNEKPDAPSSGSSKNPKPFSHKEDEVVKEVTNWFNEVEPISQISGNNLRKQLFEMVSNYRPSGWFGFDNSKKIFGSKGNSNFFEHHLKQGQRYLIELPYSLHNPSGCQEYFCKESDLNNDKKKVFFQRSAVAILRYYNHNKNEGTKNWNYKDGYEDFIYYTKFSEIWIPRIIKEAVKKIQNEYLVKSTAKQILLMKGLGLKANGNLQQTLVKKSSHIINQLPPPINEKYKEFRDELLNQWDVNQQIWLKIISFKKPMDGCPAGIDNDNFRLAINKSRKLTQEVLSKDEKRLKNDAVQELKPNIELMNVHLHDCENKEEFINLLEDVKSIYKNILGMGLYPKNFLSRETLNKDINELIKSCKWSEVQNSIKLLSVADESRQLEILSSLDGSIIKSVCKVLKNWQQFNITVLPNIIKINDTTSTNQVDKINKEINGSFTLIDEILNEFSEYVLEEVL
tara:strand:+ start:12751 stop:15849 length:3099 start_codon:yes stop_codon:yes gene_type:complete